MIFPCKFNKYGYRYTSKVRNKYGRFTGLYHTGDDYNWGSGWDDLGMPIYSFHPGVVEWVGWNQGGWGHMIITWHEDIKRWARHAHCNNIYVRAGQQIDEGQKIASIGKTGGNWSPHDHFDIIKKKLPKWTDYSLNTSIARVKQYYENPTAYINNYNQNIMGQQEEPIVKWHKKNKLIEDWSYPADRGMIRDAFAHYKALKLLDDNGVKTGIDFTLDK